MPFLRRFREDDDEMAHPPSIAKKRRTSTPLATANVSWPTNTSFNTPPTFSVQPAGTRFITYDPSTAGGATFINHETIASITIPSIKSSPAEPILPLDAGPSSRPSLEGPHLGSFATLERETRIKHAERVQKTQSSTQTHRSYSRHVRDYESWWTNYEKERILVDSIWQPVGAFPVTATKAVIFVEHESSREQVRPLK